MTFDEQVEEFKRIFVGWVQNLQSNAYAENQVIHPEVIGEAFQRLADMYSPLAEKPDWDAVIEQILNENEGDTK